MKKIISTILTFAIVIIAQSCRQQDDILSANNEISQGNSVLKKSSDSAQTDSTNVLQKPIVGDPPPKNGHQW